MVPPIVCGVKYKARYGKNDTIMHLKPWKWHELSPTVNHYNVPYNKNDQVKAKVPKGHHVKRYTNKGLHQLG